MCIINKHLTEQRESNGLDWTELARLVLDYGHLCMTIMISAAQSQPLELAAPPVTLDSRFASEFSLVHPRQGLD